MLSGLTNLSIFLCSILKTGRFVTPVFCPSSTQIFNLNVPQFDGLFGFLPGVDGLQSESAKAALPQADKNGVVYETLPPDPNGVIPPNMPNAIIDFEAIVKNASKPLPPSDITHR